MRRASPLGYQKRDALGWTRTTPFTRKGLRGTWTVRWDGDIYVIRLDGKIVGYEDVVTKAKALAESLDKETEQ